MARKPDSVFDLKAVTDRIKAMLPQKVVIDHEVTVRLKIKYVTPHPVTGEDVPLEPEVRRIGNQT